MDGRYLFENVKRSVPPRTLHKRSKKSSKKRNFPLRIFVCGPHGVGKTTLVERFISENPHYEMREEIARKYFTERGESAEDVDPNKHPERFEAFQRSIMESQCKLEERDETIRGASVIYDRGPDALVYITKYHPNGEQIRRSMLDIEHVKRAIRRYRRSLVLLLKPQKEFERKDGVRMESTFDEIVDLFECFRLILGQLKIPFRVISDADIDHRIETMQRFIVGFRHKREKK